MSDYPYNQSSETIPQNNLLPYPDRTHRGQAQSSPAPIATNQGPSTSGALPYPDRPARLEHYTGQYNYSTSAPQSVPQSQYTAGDRLPAKTEPLKTAPAVSASPLATTSGTGSWPTAPIPYNNPVEPTLS